MLNQFARLTSLFSNHGASLLKNVLWGLFIAGLLLGAGALYEHRHLATSPRAVGVVNITRVVNDYVKAYAAEGLSQESQANAIRAFGQHLERQLKQLAEEENVVLLPSEAVIAGAKDYTASLQVRLLKAAKALKAKEANEVAS